MRTFLQTHEPSTCLVHCEAAPWTNWTDSNEYKLVIQNRINNDLEGSVQRGLQEVRVGKPNALQRLEASMKTSNGAPLSAACAWTGVLATLDSQLYPNKNEPSSPSKTIGRCGKNFQILLRKNFQILLFARNKRSFAKKQYHLHWTGKTTGSKKLLGAVLHKQAISHSYRFGGSNSWAQPAG